jgi:hypothetical protein
VLYNQPDFADPTSSVEVICQNWEFGVIFLLKYHCELNPIEQCWGASKRVYREYPPLNTEAELEQNVLSSLATVEVGAICRYITDLSDYASVLLMHMKMALMGNKPHGPQRSIEATERFHYLGKLISMMPVCKSHVD